MSGLMVGINELETDVRNMADDSQVRWYHVELILIYFVLLVLLICVLFTVLESSKRSSSKDSDIKSKWKETGVADG